MLVHIDMTDSQFLPTIIKEEQETTWSDGLPALSPTEGSTTTDLTEQDFVPFTCVTSFNYPAIADSSLLSPVSTSGASPIMQQGQSKQIPFPSSRIQQPTPPIASSVYSPYYASSQSPSPLTVDSHATEMSYRMSTHPAHSPRTTHTSPKDEAPPPLEPYLGHYAVSGEGDDSDSFAGYHEFNPVDPRYLPPGSAPENIDMSQLRQPINVSSAGQVTNLSTYPDPTQFHTRPMVEDIVLPPGQRAAGIFLTNLSDPSGQGKRKKPSPPEKPKPVPRPTRSKVPRPEPQTSHPVQLSPEHRLRLDDRTEAADKFLFELRQRYIGDHGKGMWDQIQADYAEQYDHKKHEALQMQLYRAVHKHGIWPESEIKCLEEAFIHESRQIYKRVGDRMRETGGCREWDWKPKVIEAKLVQLGWIEATVDSKTRSRRRTKGADRRVAKSPAPPQQLVVMPNSGWSASRMGPPPTIYGQSHHGLSGRDISFTVADADGIIAPTFTSAEEDQYMDQIFNTGDLSDSADEMDISRDDDEDIHIKADIDGDDNANVVVLQNQRVARAAPPSHRSRR